MGTFSVELPYQMVLAESDYGVNIRGTDVVVSHSLVKQEQMDRRLGGLSGDFGLMHDHLGLLRYSRLTFALDVLTLEALERSFFADILRTRNSSFHQRRVEVALAVCNHFLDIYRAVTRRSEVRPLGANDIALLRYRDDQSAGDLRLYGGEITLPIVGLTADRHEALVASLASDHEPKAYELAILDAIRAGFSGSANEAVIVAVGALESALDSFFLTIWRRSSPPATRAGATKEVGAERSKPNTMHDVLKSSGVWRKLVAFDKRHPLGIAEKEGLLRAIDARNFAVHGGVKLPASLVQAHVRAIEQFLATSLSAAVPGDPEPTTSVSLTDAYEQAMGSSPPSGLGTIVDRYLQPYGLSAQLYSARPGHKEGPIADHFGRTMVIQIPFDDPSMTDDRVALLLSRMTIHFSLRYQGALPTARVSPTFTVGDERLGWSFVAWELNRTVWEQGADREIMALGMIDSVYWDISERRDTLLQLYGASYTPPPPASEPDFVAHLRLARVAAALPEGESRGFIQSVAAAAPQVAHRASLALPALRSVNLQDHESVRAALLQLHDAHPFLLASVAIYDPSTRSWMGRGVNLDWKG